MSELRRDLAEAPAYWLLASALLAAVVLLTRVQAFVSHPSGWRAFVGAFVLVVIELAAGVMLLRRGWGWTLGTAAFALQVVAFSVGPVSYRFLAGPYVSLVNGPDGFRVAAGVDAHYLLIIGDGNRVPAGVAINLLSALAIGYVVVLRPMRRTQATIRE